MTDLIARCASYGWTLTQDGDGYELTGNGQPAAFTSEDSLRAWLDRHAPATEGPTPYYDDGKGIVIYHGDCRTLILPEKPALVLTDPPYGMGYSPSPGGGVAPKTFSGDDLVIGDDMPFDPIHILNLRTAMILWGANWYADKLPPSSSWLVWYKKDGMPSIDFSDCEMAWSNLGGPARVYNHVWHGMLRASEREKRRVHPTQKPVALMRWCLLRAKLQPGALVYDPYMGSGPITQACKELGYRYIGCELVESYCEIAANRLSQEVMELV